jgi:hypothetical protein
MQGKRTVVSSRHSKLAKPDGDVDEGVQVEGGSEFEHLINAD